MVNDIKSVLTENIKTFAIEDVWKLFLKRRISILNYNAWFGFD